MVKETIKKKSKDEKIIKVSEKLQLMWCRRLYSSNIIDRTCNIKPEDNNSDEEIKGYAMIKFSKKSCDLWDTSFNSDWNTNMEGCNGNIVKLINWETPLEMLQKNLCSSPWLQKLFIYFVYCCLEKLIYKIREPSRFTSIPEGNRMILRYKLMQ